MNVHFLNHPYVKGLEHPIFIKSRCPFLNSFFISVWNAQQKTNQLNSGLKILNYSHLLFYMKQSVIEQFDQYQINWGWVPDSNYRLGEIRDPVLGLLSKRSYGTPFLFHAVYKHPVTNIKTLCYYWKRNRFIRYQTKSSQHH